jgi:hypothetical protein
MGENDKGFTVRDRRLFAGDAEHGEPGAAEKPSGASTVSADPRPLPEIDFSTFVLSLASSALCHLGQLPHPDTEKPEINLALAKQTIDILGMLQGKTRGNLTRDEEKLLDNLLYDLRLKYVEATKT